MPAPSRQQRRAAGAAAKTAKRQPRVEVSKPRQGGLQPFKIVGKLIGAHYDEEGNIVGEAVMGEVVIYQSQFGRVEGMVAAAVDAARAAEDSDAREA